MEMLRDVSHANTADGFLGERAEAAPPRGRRSPRLHRVARHSHISIEQLHLLLGIDVS